MLVGMVYNSKSCDLKVEGGKTSLNVWANLTRTSSNLGLILIVRIFLNCPGNVDLKMSLFLILASIFAEKR